MSNPLFRTMANKVKSLLALEARLSDDQKAAQQWQLLFEIAGLQFIVGKGGVNTMFYMIGASSRRICYPDELLSKISKWSSKKHTCYSVYSKEKELLAGPSFKKILSTDFPVGSYQVGHSDGQDSKLATLNKTLTGRGWIPVH